MIFPIPKSIKFRLILIIYFLISGFVLAQKGIRGTVYDAYTGERISNAIICEYRTTRCTKSDSLGNFFYKTLKESLTLFVSRVGYEKQWVEIKDYSQYTYQVNLKPVVYDFGLLDLNTLNLEKILNQDSCYLGPDITSQTYSPFRIINNYPKYPGGLKCLDRLFAENFSPYIISNIISPFTEIEINFYINEKGDATNIILNKEVQTEVLQLIKYVFAKMDTWSPAIQDGKSIGVNCLYTIQYDPIKDLSQEDLYQLGLDYLDKKEYDLADSLFHMYLSNSPNSTDALYNLGVAKLRQQDTLDYCLIMWISCHSFADSIFCNSYYSMCGTVDTFFVDGNYIPCVKKKARYAEVIESNKFIDYKIGIVYDKKNKIGQQILRPKHPLLPDINALYRLYDDGRTIFYYTTEPPEFPGERGSIYKYEKNSPILRSIIHNFPLDNHYARVTYIINKNGIITDPQLIDIIKNTRKGSMSMDDGDMENFEIIEESIINYLLGMPKHKPGKYRDVNIDYQVFAIISLSN